MTEELWYDPVNDQVVFVEIGLHYIAGSRGTYPYEVAVYDGEFVQYSMYNNSQHELSARKLVKL